MPSLSLVSSVVSTETRSSRHWRLELTIVCYWYGECINRTVIQVNVCILWRKLRVCLTCEMRALHVEPSYISPPLPPSLTICCVWHFVRHKEWHSREETVWSRRKKSNSDFQPLSPWESVALGYVDHAMHVDIINNKRGNNRRVLSYCEQASIRVYVYSHMATSYVILTLYKERFYS